MNFLKMVDFSSAPGPLLLLLVVCPEPPLVSPPIVALDPGLLVAVEPSSYAQELSSAVTREK